VGVTELAGAAARPGPGQVQAPHATPYCTVHHESTVSWEHMPRGTELSTRWVKAGSPTIHGVRGLRIKPLHQGHHSEKTPSGVDASYGYLVSFDNPHFHILDRTEHCR
jgi:hypothetical protein